MRRELLEAVRARAERLGITPEHMVYVSRQLFKLIREMLLDGETVGLDGLGDLRITWAPPRHVETAFGDCKDFPSLPRIWFRPYRTAKAMAREKMTQPSADDAAR